MAFQWPFMFLLIVFVGFSGDLFIEWALLKYVFILFLYVNIGSGFG